MKSHYKRQFILTTCAILLPFLTWAHPEMKLKLNEDGSQYIKATLLNQIWLRYNQSNPGALQARIPADHSKQWQQQTVEFVHKTHLKMIA